MGLRGAGGLGFDVMASMLLECLQQHLREAIDDGLLRVAWQRFPLRPFVGKEHQLRPFLIVHEDPPRLK